MLTMKHIMHPRQGERVEFCRAVGCYAVKRKDGYFQFLAYDNRDTDTPDVWSGWEDGGKFENPVVGTIYVMNDAGATIADYRYCMDGETVGPLWNEPPPPNEEEAAAQADPAFVTA